MIWTKKRPTRTGWFWYRCSHRKKVIQITKEQLRVWDYYGCSNTGQWSSTPVPTPSEAVKELKKKVKKRKKFDIIDNRALINSMVRLPPG